MYPTQDDFKKAYLDQKHQNGGVAPKRDEFLSHNRFSKKQLEVAFGSKSYSKLQQYCGDDPNALDLQKTPIDQIMCNYGRLATDTLKAENKLPVAAEWAARRLKPTESGLARVHNIRWSDMPNAFLDFCQTNAQAKHDFEQVVTAIDRLESRTKPTQSNNQTRGQMAIYNIVRNWSPARRRNSEESYQSELAQFLKGNSEVRRMQFEVREEKGDSLCDIAVGKDIGIEVKESPNLAEYDRCVGQVARHLTNYRFIIVLIMDVPRDDQYRDFCALIDPYFEERVLVVNR